MLVHHCVTVAFLQVLLLTTWCSAKTTYYVKPKSDTPCPAMPCLTLSEYAHMSDQYFAPNTTMVFLPGNHSIETGFFAVDLTSFEMHGDRAFLPDVSTRIICTEPALFHFKNISTVRVSALAFIACGTDIPNTGALDIENVLDFRLVDCSLEDSLYASALAAFNVDLTIVRTSFINYSATNVGGGLAAYSSNVSLKDSELQ